MGDSGPGAWTAYAGLAVLAAAVVGVWRERLKSGPREQEPLPDTRVLLLLAVGAWLISQAVVGLVIGGFGLTGSPRLLVAIGAHVAVALFVLRPLLKMAPRPTVSAATRVALGLIGGLATFGAVYLASKGVVELYGAVGFTPEEIPTQDVVKTLGASGIGGRLVIVLTACVLAPFAEEVFYRGVLLPALAQVMSLRLALIAQALVFGFVHVWANPFMWPLSLPLAVVGWCAGWLYVRTGSLWAAVLLHMVFNGVQIALFLSGMTA